ncbi:hypothetical protein [Oharaeibacter diazotrophicus]|uniref:hypothetical protein n=1 Tax=Oharaeibacter diazotrophicus TaxID=1920512 RepID=UPI000F8438CC|nr:hypothetical protein [Oharaeibacter diazotrophicus]GLS78827.1 hypothetical protein GCM10007904_41640 [Oharaeibacter diazotrophicus]
MTTDASTRDGAEEGSTGGAAPRPVDWAGARFAYEETREAATAIARRIGVSRQGLLKHAAAAGWKPRPVRGTAGETTAPDTRRLVASLQRTTARLVAAMETRVGTAGEGIDEREVRALGALAATLAKVIALEPDRSPRDGRTDDAPPEPGDDERRLDALVALAERFVAARMAAGPDGAADAGHGALAGATVAVPGAAGPTAAGG